MTAQISSGGVSTQPRLVLGYEAARGSFNTVHELVGGSVAISITAPPPRSGTLDLLYLDSTAAYFAFDLLNTRGTFSFTEDVLGDSPSDMLFAVVGQGVSIRLDELTRKRWIVSFEFQELSGT